MRVRIASNLDLVDAVLRLHEEGNNNPTVSQISIQAAGENPPDWVFIGVGKALNRLCVELEERRVTACVVSEAFYQFSEPPRDAGEARDCLAVDGRKPAGLHIATADNDLIQTAADREMSSTLRRRLNKVVANGDTFVDRVGEHLKRRHVTVESMNRSMGVLSAPVAVKSLLIAAE